MKKRELSKNKWSSLKSHCHKEECVMNWNTLFLEKVRKKTYLAGWESSGEITMCTRNVDCRAAPFNVFAVLENDNIEWFELEGP